MTLGFSGYWSRLWQRPKVHFLGASRRSIPNKSYFKQQIYAAYRRAKKSIPVFEIDVVVQVLPSLTIPEIGIGGYSPSFNLLYIYLDPTNSRFSHSLRIDLMPIVAHELMHCARWRGPGYGVTLGEAIVSEGLALQFESAIRGGPPWYAVALKEDDLLHVEREARANWHRTDYDRRAWFAGPVEGGPHPYKGYSLGYRIVGQKMELWGLGSGAIWARPADQFL
jgi:uncharacterized protein YjaZ